METIKINKLNTKQITITLDKCAGTLEKMLFTVQDGNNKVLISKDIENGITLQDDGTYLLSFEANDTKNMEIKTCYNWFLEIITANPNRVETTQFGIFKVLRSSEKLEEVLKAGE
jgi:hypothetical protein